jgi:hypothetical protein
MTDLPQILLWLMAFYDVVTQKMEVFSEYCLISQNLLLEQTRKSVNVGL